MEEGKKPESHMASAAAFVEGGIQDLCEDACSICLEDFCQSDPSTVTNCRHEYHLQCILEWCQRSSDCPMCLQRIILKDPASQELLEAVERERKLRAAPSRNSTIFHHPTLGDFELQRLPVGASASDLEEHIIQHLASAAAAMGRTHHFRRRESHRNRQSAHNQPHFLLFSTHPSQHSGHVSSSLAQREVENRPAGSFPPHDGIPQQTLQFPSVLMDQSPSASGSTNMPTTHRGTSLNNRSNVNHSSTLVQDGAGPSDFQSFSDSLKSRFNAVSMRYKESISRSTRGWKERLFSRNNSMSELGSEVRREVNAEIASVSCLMERLESRDNSGENRVSGSNHSTNYLDDVRRSLNNVPLNENNTPTSFADSPAASR